MAIKALEREHLQDLEFYLRAFLRPQLFGDREAFGADHAKSCLIRLLRDFRNDSIRGDFTVESEEICDAIGYKSKSAASTKQSELSRLFKGEPPEQLISRAAEIVAVLLRGPHGKKLLTPPRIPTPFVIRDWETEPEDAIASRILKVLFPSARARFRPMTHTDRPRTPTPDERGFFEFRRPYPANSYEARAELISLGWLAKRHPAGHSIRVVRVSGRCPFLQVKVDSNKPVADVEDEREVFAADGAFIDKGGRRWLLTRSGEETINLLATQRADVFHVFPKACSNPDVAVSHDTFSKFVEKHLQPREASRLHRIPLGKEGTAIRKSSRARGCSYFHPSLRFISHQVPSLGADSSMASVAGFKFSPGKSQDAFDVGQAAESVFPNLLVQRSDTGDYGPSLFQPEADDMEAFADWFAELVMPEAVVSI